MYSEMVLSQIQHEVGDMFIKIGSRLANTIVRSSCSPSVGVEFGSQTGNVVLKGANASRDR